jgi:hypothetical protein
MPSPSSRARGDALMLPASISSRARNLANVGGGADPRPRDRQVARALVYRVVNISAATLYPGIDGYARHLHPRLRINDLDGLVD